MKESVFVINSETVDQLFNLPDKGVVPVPVNKLESAIKNGGSFLLREKAENDSAYKQLIPYVVVYNNGKILTLQRTSKQGEERLHNKFSIGIGGHINTLKDNSIYSVQDELFREINEELVIAPPLKVEYKGIINDNTNDVGNVHIGALYCLETNDTRLSIRETDKMIGEWKTVDEIISVYETLETWSQLAIDYLVKND